MKRPEWKLIEVKSVRRALIEMAMLIVLIIAFVVLMQFR